MTFRVRQKTGVADTACVAMLCMATTMLLGFSNPQQTPDSEASANVSLVTAAEPVDPVLPVAVSDKIESDARAQVSFVKNSPDVPNPGAAILSRRPISLADNSHMLPLLDGIDSRLWLPPSLPALELSLSAFEVAPELFFRDVGFPDIRTYDRGKRSVFDAPGPWAPLVAWRAPSDEQGADEPIARVRCMGLSPQAVARRADLYREVIYDVAQQHEISPLLVKAVITEESCFNNQALSPVGAQGLMQLMPDTATWLNVSDPHDPVQNLSAGIRYLASLQKQFDTVELALAAYNAGPGNVRRYKGVPPFAETQAYVVKVQAHFRRYEAAHQLLLAEGDNLRQVSNAVASQ